MPGSESEEERTQTLIATNLDAATVDFLNEISATRCLRVSETGQLNAMDFVEYLDIDLTVEPQLTWIAREMLGAPMPPNAEMLISKSRIVYFHDIENDYYTLEHPLTQRYLKTLERHRLDVIALRSKPSIHKLLPTQPEILFFRDFPHLQVPCQDCGQLQATFSCEQCMMSFCEPCYTNLHANSVMRKSHKHRHTPVGSNCSTCQTKKPAVTCLDCNDYFCYACFEQMHRKGFRSDHKAMLLAVADGDQICSVVCEECGDQPGVFRCDFCTDVFCLGCFWKCHLNGNRRKHTVSKVCSNPLCNACNNSRASVFCLQCNELLCTDCFTINHYKGNRQLHMFTDAMNVLLLLETVNLGTHEHMKLVRNKVLWALTKIQAWCRGLIVRRSYSRRKELVVKIQRRWRGVSTRKKLLALLDQFQWRKKQIGNFFLPKSKLERAVLKSKYASQVGKKEIAEKTAESVLKELKDTVLATAAVNPLEDVARTQQIVNKSGDAENRTKLLKSNSSAPLTPGGGSKKVLLAAEDEVSAELVSNAFRRAHKTRRDELKGGDVKDVNEMTVRQLLKIDDRVDAVQLQDAVYSPKKVQGDGSSDNLLGRSAVRKVSGYRKNADVGQTQ